MTRVHHLNCGTLCPPAIRRLAGYDHLVCHCLLVETARDGLVLVDTGLGTSDRDRIPRAVRALLNPRFEPAECALEQVRALGFSPADVRHIVATHLDLDHVGGASDFPHARLHVHAAECYAATCAPSPRERARYVPAQLAHAPRWATYSDAGDTWMGLAAVRTLTEVEAEIALVPLVGHTRGHSGVAVRDGEQWWLHAGDAYFHRAALVEPSAWPAPLRAFERLDDFDTTQRLANLERLRELAGRAGDAVTIFCAHDPAELAQSGL